MWTVLLCSFDQLLRPPSPPFSHSFVPFFVPSLLPSLLPQHVDVALLLIKHNSQVNMTDRWNFTPLHEAAQKGRTQLCSLLVSNYANTYLLYQNIMWYMYMKFNV